MFPAYVWTTIFVTLIGMARSEYRKDRPIETIENHVINGVLRVVHRPGSFCSQISRGVALELDLGKKGRTYGFEIDAARGTRWNAEPNSGGRCFIAAEDLKPA